MIRSNAFEAGVVGILAALASFCALHASGAESYSIVAQSTEATAATGRRPISARITSSNLPPLPVAKLSPAGTASAVPATPPAAAREAMLNRVKQVLAKADETAPPSMAMEAAPEDPVATPAVQAPRRSAPIPAPARLEFDVRESRSIVTEGEQIVVRIAVRNVGGSPAERVSATLFFAEGVEPMRAIGHEALVYPGEVRFEAVDAISPGATVNLAVTAIGTRAGSVVYRGELECEQVTGRLAREGAVTVEPRLAAVPERAVR